ncbi:uncharacterized protein EV420DRAFT_1628125 [Desarmillaria tabescens]|uniref:Arrestin C-terminal-like domain-containing protein n=1 Tax=Armillaria tabescens TaxID=1929756 RepID=A0AA39NBS0_ARMTA|nr:uncharacterized protein EV420DRAFT_1628125 [Desarmillaria tabescens]KAK0462608.1 hypothetical protein EV420DRAFT_1628125 [Desarmillaria tabescens]
MRDKERPRLEILLDKDCIFLKGTGVDVEPARLSGHSTSIKEITLQFRGKARLPVPTNESYVTGCHSTPQPLTYIVCNHEWSFLEGEKKHSHTLKPGRHFFPFQLQLGGSLPSSIATGVNGGAFVAYKLRAHAVRPGLSHNLQTFAPVTLIRSFAPEALEYQQTLEIENTWPEKLMYSIMIPHKAWAAGDILTALVKFSPLSKGVGVLSITTTVQETTKIYARTGAQESSRTVATVRHEIVGGKAVEVKEHRWKPSPTTPGHSVPTTPNPTHSLSSSPRNSTHSGSSGGYFSFNPHHASSASLAEAGPSNVTTSPSTSTDHTENLEMSNDDIVTYLTFPIPLCITPTHALEPINVSHRIRWSILILNLDGHTSELRCSLPLHLLDYRLLEEARSHTSATRRLLLGGPEVPPEVLQDDMELPSYTAHVRDRVANMFLPESATMRVTNPWVHGGISPTVVSNAGAEALSSPWPRSTSGNSTPLEAHLLAHLPHAPGSGDSTPLDWVNSELLLSLSEEDPPTLSVNSRQPPPHSPSDHTDSNPATRPSSHRPSRLSSRSASPDRGLHVAGPHETYVHSGNASRNIHGLFKASMKPFSSLAHPHWLSSRSSSHSNIEQQRQATMPARPPVHLSDPNSGTALLHRAFTEVPDYRIAARGFIGGVPPLTSMRGLPSYEDVERSQGDSELAARFPRLDVANSPTMMMTRASSSS